MEKICLIVDDQPIIRAYLKAILQNEGYQTLEAEDANQALRLVQRLNGRVDLIISDITMPGDVDGVDLAYAVRAALPTIPIILISGFAEADSVQDFEVVAKPFVPTTILMAIRRATTSFHARTAQP